VTGERPTVEYLPARALDVPENVLDVSRAREEFGWEAGTELREGVAQTWAWIQTLSDSRVES